MMDSSAGGQRWEQNEWRAVNRAREEMVSRSGSSKKQRLQVGVERHRVEMVNVAVITDWQYGWWWW